MPASRWGTANDSAYRQRRSERCSRAYVPPRETVLWAERSARVAFEHGAQHVALIRVRGGNGEMERLEREGHFVAPALEQVEEAFDRCFHAARQTTAGVVTIDTWDLERLTRCSSCSAARLARLERINLSGEWQDAICCTDCGRRP